jgi:hypothetical protein
MARRTPARASAVCDDGAAMQVAGDNPYAPPGSRVASAAEPTLVAGDSARWARIMARVAGGLFSFAALMTVIGLISTQARYPQMPAGLRLRVMVPSLVWLVLDGLCAAALLSGRRRFRVAAIVVGCLSLAGPLVALATFPASHRWDFLLMLLSQVARAAMFAGSIVVLLTGRGSARRFAVGLTLIGLYLAALVAVYVAPVALAAWATSGL